MKINVKFAEDEQSFAAELQETDKKFRVDFGSVHTVTKAIGGDPYEGDYIVTPKLGEQTMQTKEKVMLDDVTVKAIPCFRVSNNSGGNTVYIAEEI